LSDPDFKRFNVLAFNVVAAWLDPTGLSTKRNADGAFNLSNGSSTPAAGA
jgi:hypothetical protein